jgi:hypothetical protein
MSASAPSPAPVDTTPDPPPTPDGYDAPTLFEYSLPVLMLLSIPMFAITAYGFGRLLWWLQGPPCSRRCSMSPRPSVNRSPTSTQGDSGRRRRHRAVET